MRLPLNMLLAVLLIVPACARNEPRSTQAASEDRNTTDQIKNQRDDYVKSVDARLAEFDQKVDGLDKRTDAMTGATKTDFKHAIDALRTQRKAVASRLDDLNKVSIESWTTLKGEVDSSLANLDRSYTQVSNMFPNNPETTTTPKGKTY